MPTKNTLLLAILIFPSMDTLYAQTAVAPGQQRPRVRRPAQIQQSPPIQGQRSPAQIQRAPAQIQRLPVQAQPSPVQRQSPRTQRQLPPAKVQRRPKIAHRWGINTAFLVQNSPLQEFSIYTNGSWYVQGYRAWIAGKAGMGLSFGFSYDVTFPSGGLFRTQLQLETTGWISGVLDVGGGVRIPIKNSISASVEGYFSTGLSGGSLARLTDHQDKQSFSVVFFGFKARGSVEFPIKKNWYSSIYISYAAYPWHAANKNPLYINGIGVGAIIDSLQIGVEFGQKF